MRIGCLFFPHFAIQVEARDNGAIAGKPIIIGGLPHERKPVYDASDEAVEHGVKPGMPLRRAYSLSPEGVFLPLDEGKYAIAFDSLLDLLASFSPVVEMAGLGRAFIDIGSQQNEDEVIIKIAGIVEKQSSFRASIACASSKFVAHVASRVAMIGQLVVVPQGEEKAFLRDLPLNLLPCSEEILRQIRLLGIHTMGQLASLPPEAVILEFGNEGKRLWELANSIDESILTAWHKATILEKQLYFEPPADSLNQLLDGASRLLGELTSQLRQNWQCCQRLSVSLYFVDNSLASEAFYLKEPISSSEVMLHRLRHWLEKMDFANPVAEIRLALPHPRAEAGRQMSLLNKPMKHKESLRSVIGQLQARYGQEIVKKVVLSESGARLPENSFFLTSFDL